MRILSFLSCAAVTGIVLGGAAWAQQQPPLTPTTVQLPTFSFFTVQTTVSVPDSGGAHLGGINRARDGRVTRGFGPLQNRAIGGDRLASGASVHARIIDFEEIDRMLLAAAARRAGTTIDPAHAKAEALTKHIAAPVGGAGGVAVGGAADHSPTPGAPLPGSVAALRAEAAATAQQVEKEIAGYFAKAQEAEAEGKPGVARIFYQMVVRRDAGALKQQAQARLAALASTKQTGVAQR
jgi:hypothetical protein